MKRHRKRQPAWTRPSRLSRRGALLFCVGALAWVPPAGALVLNPNGVTARVFSPNGDGINDVVYFSLTDDALLGTAGRILDITGGDVADLVPAGPGSSLSVESLKWDGRDRNGRVVPAGPYVYRIESGGQVLSGVVVVVR